MFITSITYMILILTNNTINTEKLSLKHGKNNIKILYNLGVIQSIGVPLRINIVDVETDTLFNYIRISDKDCLLLEKIDKKIRTLLQKPYKSFIRENNIIKMKCLEDTTITKSSPYIDICLNNIKQNIEGVYNTKIFSI